MYKTVLNYIFLLLLNFSFGTAVYAQSFNVKINADTILIGDIFTIELEVSGYPEAKVFFPIFTDTIGKFEILENYSEDTLENGFSKKWDLSVYEPGAYQLNGLNALVQNKNVTFDTLISYKPLNLFVNTLPVDTSKAFMPIKPAKSIPYPYKEVFKKYAPYIIGIILIILAILAFIWYRKKQKAKENKVITPLDAHASALNKLKEIEKQKLWQNDKTKEYYLEISETIRTYLEGRFMVNALETTTDEILENIKTAQTNKALNSKLKELLQQCDLAKYAKFKPVPEENTRLMKAAQDFVLHTKPKPEVEEPKKETL